MPRPPSSLPNTFFHLSKLSFLRMLFLSWRCHWIPSNYVCDNTFNTYKTRSIKQRLRLNFWLHKVAKIDHRSITWPAKCFNMKVTFYNKHNKICNEPWLQQPENEDILEWWNATYLPAQLELKAQGNVQGLVFP